MSKINILSIVIPFIIVALVQAIARSQGVILGALPTILVFFGSCALVNFIIKSISKNNK